MILPNIGKSRLFAAALVLFLVLVGGPVAAQAPLPGSAPPVPPTALWHTVVGAGTSEGFSTPDAACRRQHEVYNPNATYEAPDYDNPFKYGCNWDRSAPGANTIIAGWVNLECPSGWSRSRNAEGPQCFLARDDDGECDCTESAQPVSNTPTPLAGNPISVLTGAKFQSESDYASADGLFGVDRHYRSRQHRGGGGWSTSAVQGFGPYWHGIMPGRLTVYNDSSFNNDVGHFEYLTATGGVDYFSAANVGDQNSWTFVTSGKGRRKLEVVNTPTTTRQVYLRTDPAIANGPGEFRMTEPDGSYILFRRSGTWNDGDRIRYLVPVEQGEPGGYVRYFDYPDTDEFPNKVRDNLGREMTLSWAETKNKGLYSVALPGGGTGNILFHYNTPHKMKVITQIVLPDATKLVYTYGDTSSLTRVGRDDRLTRVSRQTAGGAELWAREYLYENNVWPYALTGTKDQNGNRLSTYGYHPYGLAASSERAGGVGRVEVNYTVAPSGNEKRLHRSVINPLGRQENYEFYHYYYNTPITRPPVLTDVEGLATASVPADSQTIAYQSVPGINVGRIPQTITDRRGAVTKLTNDTTNLRPTAITEAFGTTSVRTTNIAWHATLDLPEQVDVPGLRTNYTYDATGQLLTRTLTDTTTHTLPYVTAGQTRVETYTWGTGGRLASVNGPRAAVGGQDDITGFAYDAAGNLLTMTNALGHVTTFASYDANGRPGSMTDANGAVTLFAYDALGRLLTSNRKDPTSSTLDAITTYDYDVEGRVKGITLPGTQRMAFTYDLAGQLLQVGSTDGERWRVQRDAMGNITQEKIKAPGGADVSTITRSFDSLGRMLTETLGTGRTTAWEYDKNGNPTRTNSPRSHATDMAFDPLNRLISTLAPDSGTTATGYDAKDDIAAFTDAASVQTSFVRNGFGEVIRENSPDRGTSVYEYDSAGNLTKATDGRGQVIDYSYDILNRLTQKTPVGRPASEVVSYTYDSNTLGACWCVGRLATMTDVSGTTRFGYDHRGNFIGKNIVGTTLGTMSLKYDLADRIVQTRLPSARFVAYTRDDKGRVIRVETRPNSSSAWTTLADNIVYEPLGPMKSADLGNGLKLALDWGTDRRLASKRLYTAAGVDVWHVAYGYDADDNIVAITDLVNPANSLTYGYDSVHRLTRMDGTAGAFARQDFLHDANGNRTAVERRTNIGDLTPAESDTYTKASGTNRLASVTMPAGTRGFTHDARGNLTGETLPGGGTVTLAYDGHARLTAYAATGAPSQAMAYNGFDERTQLVTTPSGGGAAATRHFLYDQHHRLIGEFGATASDLRAEYIWMLPEVGGAAPFGGDDGLGGYMPLAVVVPAGGSTAIQWIQGNHLGTPVAVTDASGAVVTPGGYSMAGFPGQVRQHAELYYNYYRDYDVSLGRYVQADPIGLDGDANPYAYASNNPLIGIDPLGLTKLNWHSRYDDPMWYKAADRAPDTPGVCKIYAHGSFLSILDDHAIDMYDRRYGRSSPGYTANGRRYIDIGTLAERIKRECKDDERIELWACNTGTGNDSIASNLARTMRRQIRAPQGNIWRDGLYIHDQPSTNAPSAGAPLPTDKWRTFDANGVEIPS
jgi:RHS repeat-associated protein